MAVFSIDAAEVATAVETLTPAGHKGDDQAYIGKCLLMAAIVVATAIQEAHAT